MKTIENRGISQVLVSLTALDLARIIEFRNNRASAKAVKEVEENDTKGSLAIYESFNTSIGGTVLSLIDCIKTGESPQSIYKVDNEEYIYLLSKQAD